MVRGIVFICDNDFIIKNILLNGFDEVLFIKDGIPFQKLFVGDEKKKIELFQNELKINGVVFNWEINVLLKNEILPLKFSGGKNNGDYFILALETNNDVPFLYEELLLINNEQSNSIRKILKEKFLRRDELSDVESTFDEMSRLNNDLVNLKRQLAQSNIKLKQLNEIKNNFLGMAAHDLRNPLGQILNFTDFILEDTSNFNSDQIEFLNLIKSRSKFMLDLVNDLLDVSEIESENIRLDTEKFDLNEFTLSIVKMMNPIANSKNITIEYQCKNENVFVEADAYKIEQVLTNLLTNAIKYSEPNTVILINLFSQRNFAKIAVKDQGRGIKEDELKSVFNPFQKTSTKSTAGEESMGLGLFIARKIIEAHKGIIWVESVYGKGSTFYFQLPLIN
ncbi:MAG: HAMP domain-containing histidine kinase [Melioribacteraceae bacterium]|nr:HAMP domain-containing histidine kinase [Melioribacteraceae bacterium]